MSRFPIIVDGVEIQNAEDLACLGMHLVPDPNDPWASAMSELRDPDAFIKSFPPPKRARRVSIRQIEKETGRVVTAVTVAPDGTRTYALGERGDAPISTNPWDSIYETEQKRPS